MHELNVHVTLSLEGCPSFEIYEGSNVDPWLCEFINNFANRMVRIGDK